MAKCNNCVNLHRAYTGDGRLVNTWCFKIDDSPCLDAERDCEYYKHCETMTRADFIRGMTDEELSDFLEDVEASAYQDASVSGNLEMIEWLHSRVRKE